MKALSLRIFAAVTFFVSSLAIANHGVYAQCPPNCSSTRKTVNVYWADLGVEWWKETQATDWQQNKAKSNSNVKVYDPPKLQVKFGDTLERLGGATVPGGPREGEIALPMPTNKPMTRAELNKLRDQIADLIQQKIDSGATNIELRDVQDLGAFQHLIESKSPIFAEKQRIIEQISLVAGQALAKVKFSNKDLNVGIEAVCGSNGCRALSRVISKLGPNVISGVVVDSSRASEDETVELIKTVGKDNVILISPFTDFPALPSVTADHKTAERIADAYGVKLYRTKNANGLAVNPFTTHIQVTKPSDITIESRRYLGKGEYADAETASRGDFLLSIINGNQASKAGGSPIAVFTPPPDSVGENTGKGSLTEVEAKERNELLQVKSLVDKGDLNRDSLSPQMRKQLEQFEANQAIVERSVKSKRTTGKPDNAGRTNPVNRGNPATGSESETNKLLNAQRILQNQLANGSNPTASNPELEWQLKQKGIKVVRASDEGREDIVAITATPKRGYAETDVHIVNKTDDTTVAIDFSEYYLNPKNENSSSQRLGLVAVIEKRVSMRVPDDLSPHLAALGLAEPLERTRTVSDDWYAPAKMVKASFSFVENSHPQSGGRVPTSHLAQQDRGEPEFLAVRHWVIVAPRADVVVPFHSVCLDHGRGVPSRGEHYYASDRPLPPRIQQILVAAARRGEVPQGQVWGTISDEHIKWYDPRDGVEALRKAKSEYGSQQYSNAIESCRVALSYKPEWPDAIAMLGLSYYSMGLNSPNADQASSMLSESYKHLAKAMELGQEFSFPVKHHISLGTDQRLSSGMITLTKDSLSYRSTDNEGRDLKALYSQIYELRMEAQKFGRLHMNIYGVAYNFHPPQTYTTRETTYLTPTAPISVNVLHCDGNCYLTLTIINNLANHFISRSAGIVGGLKESGESLMKDNKLPEAEAKFREAMQLNPYNVQLLTDLGLVLMRQQKMAAAEEQFRTAVKVSPNEEQAYINLGTALAGQEKWKEAESEFRRAVKLNPKDANWRGILGMLLNQQKKWGDAETQLREVVKIEPNNAQWHANLGYTLMNRKKLAEAEAQYREAVRLETRNAFWHLGLGGVFEKQQKLAETETEYREALRLAPENPLILNNLGYHLVQQGKNLDEALRMIELAVKAEPKNANSLDSLGWAYFKVGKLEEAERHLNEAARLNATSAPIQEHLGDLYQQLGKMDQARAAWQKALSLPEEETNQRDRIKIKTKDSKK